MPNIKLSVIVPIYNVEQYLRKCIDSLLQQDLSHDEYEIILVDDGSTDNSGSIADEYALSHNNIDVIHQKNAGLSVARNSGISIAQGKYIQFVDSDDYLEPNALGELITQCEREKLDVLHFNYQDVRIVTPLQDGPFSGNTIYEVYQPDKFPHPIDTRTDVVDGKTYLNERMFYACYACHFILRREIVGTFIPGIYFEDTEWAPRMLLKANRVNSTDKVVYNYLHRMGSITNAVNIDKLRKVIKDKLSLITSLQSLKKQALANERWLTSTISTIALSIMEIITLNFWDTRDDYLRRLKDMEVYPLRTHFSKRMNIKMRLVNISPVLYCVLLRWYRHRCD